jgi:glycosyltransferase involved in cell wall biosynthesis
MGLKRTLKRLFAGEGKRKDNPQIINLYRTSYRKRICISYLTGPFLESNHFKHQNFLTSHIVAEVFSELGYNVDVYDYLADVSIPYDSYDIIFGIGDNFERSFYSADRSILRIHLITGTHQELHNANGLMSIRDFYKLSGIWLADETNIMAENHYYSMYEADIGLIMAEGFVFEHCKSVFTNKLYTLNNNILGTFLHLPEKTHLTSNFLFLSGGKQITKGLPFVLEVARLHRGINFYIVIPELDTILEKYYGDVLGQSNVFLFKDLRMDSTEMKEIIEWSSFVIAPSYVDGLPGGTIEPMSAGLVPIVSKYCGFGKQDFVFELEELSVECLSNMLSRLASMNKNTYLSHSRQVRAYALENYTKDKVKMQLKDILNGEFLPR